MTLNRYGKRAQEHWREFLPNRMQQIPEPEEFFRLLGEQAEQEIDLRTDSLAGEPPENESYLEGVARLETARKTAESAVLREMILVDPEDEERIQQLLA